MLVDVDEKYGIYHDKIGIFEDDEDEFDSIWNGSNPFVKRKEITDAVIRIIDKKIQDKFGNH